MWIATVPSQEFTGSTSHESCKTPENRLMLAVLQDALVTFHRGLNTVACEELESFREVDRWFRSRDYDSPFSFESICCTLRIDPGYVRSGLNKVKRRAFMRRIAMKGQSAPPERTCTRGWRNLLH
jgi:hypothetical protein